MYKMACYMFCWRIAAVVMNPLVHQFSTHKRPINALISVRSTLDPIKPFLPAQLLQSPLVKSYRPAHYNPPCLLASYAASSTGLTIACGDSMYQLQMALPIPSGPSRPLGRYGDWSRRVVGRECRL